MKFKFNFIIAVCMPVLMIMQSHAQNTCATAINISQASLPFNSGNQTTCGTGNDYGVGSTGCNTLYGGGEDYVYALNITSAPVTLNFSLGGSATYKICQIFTGCPSPTGAPTNCLGNMVTSSGTSATGNFTFPSTGTYYVVIDTWPAPACGAFTLGISNLPTCPGGLGTGLTQIASLPYSSGAQTTCGKVNDLTTSNLVVCGSTSYFGGEDVVYSFTPTTSGQININITSTGSYLGAMLYQGCPINGGSCVSYAQSSSGNQSLCGSVTAGQVYYLVIDSWPAPTCNPYNLSISAVGSCVSSLGSGVVNVGSLPYSTSGTTCGSGNDLTSSNVSTSGCSSSSYFSGEEQVFVFTPTTSGMVSIGLTSNGSYTGLMLYNTCPLSCGGTGSGCVASSQSSTGSKTLTACLNAGTTYYLILDSWANPTCNAYSNLSISAPGTVSGSNDACMTPQALTNSGTYTGSTTGFTADQPGNLSSVFCGSIENNQWFSFVATSSSATFSFSNVTGCSWGIQAQVFNLASSSTVCASCSSFTSMSSPCYNPGTTTSGAVTATGLTSGQTYYMMVDGNGGDLCNFTLNGWSTSVVLPVHLINFSGEAGGPNTNKLFWKVADEKDLSHYVLYRSGDAKNFSEIGKIEGKNISAASLTYDFTDKEAVNEINYYQLKMVDHNGYYKYSNVIALNNSSSERFIINRIFPNPAKTILYSSVTSPVSGVVSVEVLDVTGRMVQKTEHYVSYGNSVIGCDLQGLSKGIYYIRLEQAGAVNVQKFVIQ